MEKDRFERVLTDESIKSSRTIFQIEGHRKVTKVTKVTRRKYEKNIKKQTKILPTALGGFLYI
jgi:hypothetical protein